MAELRKGELVAFHNHPASMPPSADDINAALKNGYKKGYALCHDGTIYEYTASEKLVCRHSYVDKDDEFFCQQTDEPCTVDVENDVYTTCEEFEHQKG